MQCIVQKFTYPGGRKMAVAYLVPSITDAFLTHLHDLGHIVLGIQLSVCIHFL